MLFMFINIYLIVKYYSSISSVYVVRSFYWEYVYHCVCLSQHMHDIRHAVRVYREMLAKTVLHYGKTALPSIVSVLLYSHSLGLLSTPLLSSVKFILLSTSLNSSPKDCNFMYPTFLPGLSLVPLRSKQGRDKHGCAACLRDINPFWSRAPWSTQENRQRVQIYWSQVLTR